MPPKPKLTRKEKIAKRKEAKLEKKKQLKRDRLIRELKYSELTMKRYEKEWELMLKLIALPELRNDVELVWHNYERVIDYKDFTISLLMDELKHAEEQYDRNFEGHIDNIERITDMYRETLEEFQRFYQHKLEMLHEEMNKDSEGLNDESIEDENYLKTIIHILEVNKKAQEQHNRAEYVTRIEEEEKMVGQALSELNDNLTMSCSNLKNQTMSFINKFKATTKERRNEHDRLSELNCATQELMENQLKEINANYECIKDLNNRYAKSQLTLGRKLEDAEGEYNFFLLARNKLKERSMLDNEIDFKKMSTLSQCYNKNYDYLKGILKIGEKALTISAICRKLETIKEKIMPFPVANVTTGQKTKYLQDYDLEFFHQRYGQVEASKLALREEKLFLKTEQEILKKHLRRFCKCISCPNTGNTTAVNVEQVAEESEESQKQEKHVNDEKFINE